MGTGRIARELAEELVKEGFNVLWVTRHQLIKPENIIKTKGRNSAKAPNHIYR